MQQNNGSEFRPEEIITLRHFDKKSGQWVANEYPKVGGRLRLAHLHNDTLDINTEVFQYDGNLAVVKAVCTTNKGSYCGMGMASLERDAKIAPALLELAETRAIARALRFAGFGVEYCSAEEVSHLDQEKEMPEPREQPPAKEPEKAIYCPHTPGRPQPAGGGVYTASYANGRTNGSGGQGGANNGNGRLTQKQHGLLLKLAEDRGMSRSQLDDMSRERFGCVLNFVSKGDASSLIGELTAN